MDSSAMRSGCKACLQAWESSALFACLWSEPLLKAAAASFMM